MGDYSIGKDGAIERTQVAGRQPATNREDLKARQRSVAAISFPTGAVVSSEAQAYSIETQEERQHLGQFAAVVVAAVAPYHRSLPGCWTAGCCVCIKVLSLTTLHACEWHTAAAAAAAGEEKRRRRRTTQCRHPHTPVPGSIEKTSLIERDSNSVFKRLLPVLDN